MRSLRVIALLAAPVVALLACGPSVSVETAGSVGGSGAAPSTSVASSTSIASSTSVASSSVASSSSGMSCGDVITDPANCGSCGHACLAGTGCADGACPAVGVVYGLGDARLFAVAGDRLFYIDDFLPNMPNVSSVGAVPVDGSAASTTLGMCADCGRGLAGDASGFYWSVGPQIFRVGPGETSFSTFFSPSAEPSPLVTDGAYVYWLDGDSARRTSEAGGAEELIVTDPSIQVAPWEIAVDDASVYWTDQHSVFRAPKAGGAAVKLAAAEFSYGLVAFAGYAYWSVGTSISRVSAAGGAPEVIASGAPLGYTINVGSRGLAVDATGVYFMGSKTTGNALMRVPHAGGMPVVLSSFQPSMPAMIVLGSDAVYFSFEGFGAGNDTGILRAAK
jgi:hypothetical protein